MSSRNQNSKSGGSKRSADSGSGQSNMGFDVEQQLILRLPQGPAGRLAAEIEAGHSLKDRLSFVFDSDMRHIAVHYGAKTYPGKLMDLPTITESLKTTDKKTFYKTGDICQVLICKEEGDDEEEKKKQAEQDLSPRKKEKMVERQFVYNHGLTPPLKNVRKKRFRKTMKKKFLDMPEIEKEVKRLLRVDLEAREVKWEVVFEDEPSVPTAAGQGTSGTATSAVGIKSEEAVGGEAEAVKAKGKDLTAAKNEIFGYLSSDEEEENASTARQPTPAAAPVSMETSGGDEGDGSSILERACRMTLTEEDLRPFAEAAAAEVVANDGLAAGPGDSSGLAAPYLSSAFSDDEGGRSEAALRSRLAELTEEIERLKAFINVRESQLPHLDNEKFRERLQLDIDSYGEQLSECRREFERLSGQLEAMVAGGLTV